MKYKPHDYQKYAIGFIKKNPIAAILLDMGSGKTRIVLSALNEQMYDSFEVSKVLIIAPLRVARNTWSDEIKKWGHLNGIRYSIAVGTAAERIKSLQADADITAFVLVFPPVDEDDRFCVLPYFWIPEETLDLRVRRDHVPCDVWERQGFLKTTEGNVVHYGFIEKFIERLVERYNIRKIAFDRWGAVQMVQNLERMGFTVVLFGQGFKDMSPPTKELMKLTMEKKLAHGGLELGYQMRETAEKGEPEQNPGSRPPTVLRRKPARGRSPRYYMRLWKYYYIFCCQSLWKP